MKIVSGFFSIIGYLIIWIIATLLCLAGPICMTYAIVCTFFELYMPHGHEIATQMSNLFKANVGAVWLLGAILGFLVTLWCRRQIRRSNALLRNSEA